MAMDPVFKDTEDILDLIKKAQSGDTRAENKLVKIYEPYVEYMVKRYSKKTDIKDDDDLRSYIYLGLLDGIRKFDPNKNTRFIYFTHIWMKKNIFLGEQHYRFIKIPANQRIFYTNFLKKLDEEEEDGVDYAQDEEIQKYLVIENTKTNYFTDFNVYDEETGIYNLPENIFLSKSIENFEENQKKETLEILKNNINSVLEDFSDKERYIIEHLFGLNNKEKLDSSQIAKNLNVTKVNVMFTRNMIFKILRHSSLLNKILKNL